MTLYSVNNFAGQPRQSTSPPNFNRKLKIDFCNKKIQLHIYQVILPENDVPAKIWLDHGETTGEVLHLGNLKIVLFDNCGNELYQHQFKGLTLAGHTIELDYSVNEPVIDVLELDYEKVESCPIIQTD